MTDRSRPRSGAGPRFSRAAATYERQAEVQRAAAARLLSWLDDVPDPAHILEVGCGTGLFTRLLRRRWPRARIDAIDPAAGMVAAARASLAGDERLRFHVAAGESFTADAAAELITGNCAVHWLRPFAAGVRQLARQLAPGGRLAVSLMLDGTLAELHEARRRVAPGKPAAARLPTGRETEEALAGAGLALLRAEEATSVRTHAGAGELLRVLQEQGLTGGDVFRGTAPLSRRELAALCSCYEDLYRDEGGRVRATYRVGYYLAARER